ncbi:hypothetical protein ACIO3O_37975 [Streptomyces sp. NPDC087440]|uniref:hypothetical protein n=1 Tax=Streptomyces sp. NPDC087440 TaxID=3365790 RepID=UPI00380A6EAB
MPTPSRPLSLTVDGQELVSREWIAQKTGSTNRTVTNWQKKRLEQPEDARFPEKRLTADRVDYYDRTEFEAFHTALVDRKKKKVLSADPALYTGDADELVPLPAAAQLLGLDPSAIRKYLTSNPGYFPEPTGTATTIAGKIVRAFRRQDLRDFDNRRNGDNTGVSGRRPGTPSTRQGTTPEVEERVRVARQFLKEIGGWRRGAAGELAAREGGSAWQWDRAMRTARAQAEQDTQ